MACARVLAFLVACGAVSGAAAPARSAPLPACTGRFIAHGSSGVVAGARVVTDTVLVDGMRPMFVSALEPSCPARRARVKGTKKGTRVSCTWKKNACGVPFKVKLKGLIAGDCGTLTATVKTGRTPTTFTAPRCGDGTVDTANGETCDGTTGCDAGLACVACRCGSTTTTTTLPGGTTTTTLPVSFARQVQPILTAGCLGAGCHAGQFPAQNLDMGTAAKAYGVLTTKQSTENPCTGMELVVPGSPETSVLMKKLTGTSCGFTQMPLGRPPLSAVDLATISAWIAQGAANN